MTKLMSQSVPVTLSEWHEFLRGYSEDYLRIATEEQLADFDDVQRGNRWLGYEAADETAVRAAEERVGVQLPPSYRNFLLASNGWRKIHPCLYELLKADEIGWLPMAEPELWDLWSHDEHLAHLLRSVLLLSGPADGDYWLLDVSKIGPDGEWTAYFWLAGSGLEPEPYPSFGALVARARRCFEELSALTGRPVDPGQDG